MREAENEDSGQTRCPRCGQELIRGERYCPNCGVRLRAAAPGVFGRAWRFFTSPGSASLGLRKECARSAFRFLAAMALLPALGGAGLASFYLILLGPALRALGFGANVPWLALSLVLGGFLSIWLAVNCAAVVGASILYILLGFLESRGGLGLGGSYIIVSYSLSPFLLLGFLLAIPFVGLFICAASLIYSLIVLYIILRKGFGVAPDPALISSLTVGLAYFALAWLLIRLIPPLGYLRLLLGAG